MPRTRPPYSPEFRQQIIELVRAGRSPEELARELEPTAQTIGNWVKQADRDDGRRQAVPIAPAAAAPPSSRRNSRRPIDLPLCSLSIEYIHLSPIGPFSCEPPTDPADGRRSTSGHARAGAISIRDRR